MANRITTLFDLDAKGFDSGLKKLRGEVAKADGAVNKLKTAGSGLGTILQDNIANAALAAGAALVAFGVKSVQAFQDTALAAGQFADATGVSVEAASRLIEVSGDIGIEAGTVESALGKMNKTLGASPDLFNKLGVEIAKTDSGATDVNGTFLNVVDRLNAIEDPAERARVASQLLGKGWQGMAELIGQGSAELKASLAGVADAQVIDEDELKKAREFRERMDDLNDRLQAVMMTVGESLVPALSDMADQVGMVSDAVDDLTGAEGGGGLGRLMSVADALSSPLGAVDAAMQALGDSTDETIDSADAFSAAWAYVTGNVETSNVQIVAGTEAAAEMARIYGERVVPTVGDTTQAFDAAAEEANDLAIKTGRVERAAEALGAEWDRLKGRVSDDQAWLDMQATFDDVRDKGAAAMQAVADGADNADDLMREFQTGVNTAKDRIIELGQQIGMTPSEVEVLLTMTDNGSIDDVERRLAILTRNRIANLDIIARGGAGYGDRFGGARATGGPVTAGTPYLVGERGPEIVVPGRSGTVIPNNRIGGMGGGGMTVNITTGADPQAVVAAIKKYEKSNGAAWRS